MRALHSLIAAVALVGAGTVNAGLLVNESFEAGTLGTTYGQEQGLIPGWQFQAGAGGWGGISVTNQGATGKHGSNFALEQYGVLQTASNTRPAVSPGDSVDVSVLFMAGAPSWTDTMLYIDFYADANGWSYSPVVSLGAKNLPNANWGGTFASEFNWFSTSAVAPAGATHVGVRFVTPDPRADWSGGNQAAMAIDNVLVTVPEPATLSLLGLAGLLLGRRRSV